MALPIGIPLPAPIVPGHANDAHGTHYSYLGTGGHHEVLTLTNRNSIPVSLLANQLNADGLSSGRRRLGMTVYVQETGLIYILKDSLWGTYVTDADKYASLSSNTNWVTISSTLVGDYIPLGGTNPILPVTGNVEFVDTKGIDNDSAGGALNIGTTNADVINIGNAGTIVNIYGTTLYSQVTNLEVEDKVITLNKGGAVASGGGTGFEVEENSVATGYFKVTTGRDGWDLKAPTSYVATISQSGMTGDHTYTLPDADGTFALTSDIVTITASNGLTKTVNNITLGGPLTTNTTITGGGIADQWALTFGTTGQELGYFNALTLGQVLLKNSISDTDTVMQLSGGYANMYYYSNTTGLGSTVQVSGTYGQLIWVDDTNEGGAAIQVDQLGVNVQSIYSTNIFARLRTTNLTGSHIFEFPDASGTLALVSDVADYYTGTNGITIFSGIVTWGTTPLTQVTQLDINTLGGGYLQFINDGGVLIDMSERKAYSSFDELVFDWENGTLGNPVTGETVFNLETGEAYSYSGVGDISMDVYQRTLNNIIFAPIFNWSCDNAEFAITVAVDMKFDVSKSIIINSISGDTTWKLGFLDDGTPVGIEV